MSTIAMPHESTNPASGAWRLRDEGIADGDRGYSMGMHLSMLLVFVTPILAVVPFVMWMVKKDGSDFIDDHGREIVNFMISFVVVTILLCVSVIGLIAVIPFFIVGVIGVVRGACAANRQEYFRYPMTIRFLN